MTTVNTINGKPQRKQLSEQLDRLDSIIDCLADVLPKAVADACRDGARAAMKDAILEVLTNPELRAMLAPVAPAAPVAPPSPPEPTPAPEPKPSFWARLKAKAVAAKDAVVGAAEKAKDAVTDPCKAARDTVAAVGKATGEAVPLRKILWTGVVIGGAVGVACLLVPHAMAAAVGAVGAAATAVAVQTGNWLKKAARRVGLVS